MMNHKELYMQLQNALINDEFDLYYQPYYSVNKNKWGVEALLRWDSSDYGLLLPSTFLNVAEDTGLIIDIEEWVLNKAILEIQNLNNKYGESPRLSVNISAIQLENTNFLDILSNTLNMHSFYPEFLTLEITERFLIKKSNIKMLKDLKNIGVQISIDDFGTFYSALKYLRDLPIDEIKIDRGFIKNIDSNFNSRKIVEMIIMLGHQLNLIVVGEGVETKEQLQVLQKMNCDYVQVFLFSEPISYQEIKHEIQNISNLYNQKINSLMK